MSISTHETTSHQHNWEVIESVNGHFDRCFFSDITNQLEKKEGALYALHRTKKFIAKIFGFFEVDPRAKWTASVSALKYQVEHSKEETRRSQTVSYVMNRLAEKLGGDLQRDFFTFWNQNLNAVPGFGGLGWDSIVEKAVAMKQYDLALQVYSPRYNPKPEISGAQALADAIARGKDEFAQYLKSGGISLNDYIPATGFDHVSLVMAVRWKDHLTVSKFLEEGMPVKYHETAEGPASAARFMWEAIELEKPETAELFVSHLLPNGSHYFLEDAKRIATTAFKKKYDQLVIAFLEHGLDQDGIAPGKSSLLHKAIRNANLDLASYLINLEQNLDEQDSTSQSTPLHLAVYTNRLDYVSLLVEKGARTDLRDTDGLTPLMLAEQLERADIIQALRTDIKG